MKTNILRQVKDIQYQADKILKRNPSLIDVKNFAKYSSEIKKSLEENIDIPMVLELLDDIPEIEISEINTKKGFLSMILPSFMGFWYYERSLIEDAKSEIQIAQGKYASIEFILKNHFYKCQKK